MKPNMAVSSQQNYDASPQMYINGSVVNSLPVCGIWFRFGKKKTTSVKNIWEPVFEDIILGFLMADTSSKRQKIYGFCKICHIFTLY